MTISNLLKAVASASLISIYAVASSAPAIAAVADRPGGTAISTTVVNPDCVFAFSQAGVESDGLCMSTLTLVESAATSPTILELQSAGVVGQTASKLTLAVALTTILSKSYSQNVNSITDSVTQSGRFYYDGTRAWVGTTTSGYRGTHFCKLDWSVGYAISLVGCTETGGIAYRNLHMQWHYSAIASGLPVQWEEIHTVTVNKNGAVTQ